MDERLCRYTTEQQEVIVKYWDTIRWTRKTGKIADGVKQTELSYWEQYDSAVVIKALAIHMEQYPKIKETYTRGIMRNIATTQTAKTRGRATESRQASHKQNKTRFANFPQRDWDYEAIAYLEGLKNAGLLTDEKRRELQENPRYQKYLV